MSCPPYVNKIDRSLFRRRFAKLLAIRNSIEILMFVTTFLFLFFLIFLLAFIPLGLYYYHCCNWDSGIYLGWRSKRC